MAPFLWMIITNSVPSLGGPTHLAVHTSTPWRYICPFGGILEEVPDFSVDATKSGQSPLELLERRIKEIKDADGKQFYTGFVVIELDPEAWVEMARTRLHINYNQGRLRRQQWFAASSQYTFHEV